MNAKTIVTDTMPNDEEVVEAAALAIIAARGVTDENTIASMLPVALRDARAVLTLQTQAQTRDPAMSNDRQVWKYPLKPGMPHAIPGHRDSPIALVAQDPVEGVPAVWIEQTLEPADDIAVKWQLVGDHCRTFIVVGTGWDVPKAFDHRGSCVCGEHVWHIYEKRD